MIFHAGVIVVFTSIIFPITLVITYTMSVYNEHIMAIWPYISHTGNNPIESCFFSFGVNLVAGLYSFLIYLRFLQVVDYLEAKPSESMSKLNKSSIIWGLISSFSLSGTACFQQRNVTLIHMMFALLCTFSALVYFWHQTAFTYCCTPSISVHVKRFRLALSILCTIIHIMGPILFFYALLHHPLPDGNITKWTGDREGLSYYVTGSSLEWFVFFFNDLYVASFYMEFTPIQLKTGEIIINRFISNWSSLN